MSPDLHSPNQAFDISLLDVETLNSPGGLENALRSIENMCLQAEPAMAGMVLTLSSRSHVLEYIFSGTLRVPVVSYHCARRVILFASVGREGIRDTVQLDRLRFPDTDDPRYHKFAQHETPPTPFRFPAICRVPVRCRRSSRTRGVLEEGRTLIQDPSGSRSEYEEPPDGRRHISNQQ